MSLAWLYQPSRILFASALKTILNVTLDFVKARLLYEEMKFNTIIKKICDENEVDLKATTKVCYDCCSVQHFQAQCPKCRGSNTIGRGYFRDRDQNYAGQSYTLDRNPNLKHHLICTSKLIVKGYKIIVEKDNTTINSKECSLNYAHKSGIFAEEWPLS